MYKYTGMNQTGKEVKGAVTGDNLQQAKQKVRSLGLMLTNIEEQSGMELKKSPTLSFVKKINITDLALMTRQLATLLRAKIQVVQALDALIDQSTNPHMKIVLSEVKQKVNEGSSLAKAMADYPRIFNNIYINMVEAGEASGTLDVVLLRLADFTENQVKLRNRIRGAMTYPVIMMIFGVVMLSIIFVFVIPKITKIFISMKKELPLQTKICIWVSDFLIHNWYILIPSVFFIYYVFKRYIASESGRKVWDAFLLKLPFISELVIMINVQRFCSTLGTLLNSSVPILTSLSIVRNLVANVHMQKAVEEARESVSEGASLTAPLTKSGLYPPMVTHMIRLGEKSGELEPMLKIVAENYEDQVNTKLSGLTSILEPIMLVVMGMAVAFVVFSVVVPMMELNKIR